ncbi:MAG TPA: hypothetical protein VEM93_00760, partial [Actinomycetota bacterium]|nr:hypothetical protein [Actinomycetota bacterium]
MMRWVGVRAIVVVGILVLVAAACTGGDEDGQETGPVTITVLDYYGEATPLASDVIERFEQENPGIKVQYEAGDWDSMHE